MIQVAVLDDYQNVAAYLKDEPLRVLNPEVMTTARSRKS